MQDGRHVFLRSELAGHFYNRDIGRMHFAGTYSRRFIRGHRVELTAWRNLIKIYIGSVRELAGTSGVTRKWRVWITIGVLIELQ